VKLIQEIGSYAGFAAVVGLAVLSALYFSQARDVRRLRDWAGRAPERDAEARARVAAASSPAVQARPAASQQPQGQAVGATGAATAAGRGGVAAPPRPPTERPSSGSTQILDSSSNGRYAEEQPWYRRLPPAYIALIVAGVIVVGGGIAFGAITLLGGDSGGDSGKPPASASKSSGSGQQASTPAKPKAPAIKPSDVTVQVFNGTLVEGLGRKYHDKIQALGFNQAVQADQAPGDGLKAESVVFYKPGQKAKAQLVRKKLGLNNIEPLDDVFSPLANQATQVVVVVGSDHSGG
jgi:hypothetical protein